MTRQAEKKSKGGSSGPLSHRSDSEALVPTRVVIVEDDVVDRKSLRRLLHKAPMNYEVLEFGDAENALTYMAEVDVDCVLLDVHLPLCSGAEFLGRLASRHGAHRPGVVVVSGDGSQRVGIEMIKAGAQEFVQKGELDSSSLCEAIERVVMETRLHRKQEKYAFTEKLASLNQLVASTAHEINNPAAIARLTLGAVEEMLSRDENTDPARLAELGRFKELVSAADDALARIGSVVRGLEQQTGSSLGHINQVSLDQIVRSAMPSIDTLPSSQRRIIYDLRAPRPFMGDLPQLARAVFDLVSNAVEATTVGGTIRISTLEHDSFAELIVGDDGAGIPTDQMESVLEPLFSTRRERAAIGMGLPRANATIERHGGELELGRSPLGGAQASVRIPFKEKEVAPRSSTRVSLLPNGSASNKARVLVVDDEPEIRKSYQRVLALDCDVDAAKNVAEAMKMIARNHYDAILCDVIMPEHDGTHLAKLLLDEAPEQADGLVFCSGGVLQTNQLHFVSNWTNGYLRKPLSADELRSCLLDFIERRRVPLQ